MSKPKRKRRKPLPPLKQPKRRYTFSTLEAAAEFLQSQPPQCWHVIKLHDDDCPMDRYTPCTCAADYVVEEMTTDNVMRGARLQQQWLKSRAN